MYGDHRDLHVLTPSFPTRRSSDLFDAMAFYAQRTGKALRVAQSNPDTGGIDVDELVGLIDQDTCLLNVIYASNISGAKLDLEAIVQKVRAIKPDLYILVEAVQHAPHGQIGRAHV